MRGYWQRPEETQLRLVTDPENGARKMYKTGDAARIDKAGVIHFVGRRDNQIKLHGYRIEPAEIETILDRYPGVKASAVLSGEGAPGHQELVAFVIRSHTDAMADRAVLVEHCTRHLPPHMIPRRFIFLDEFPETSTGKLDRGKLRQSLLSSEKDRERPDAK
jgi:acyl-coenzyme A synthetase/AMP-(fatty) acid ligase